MNDSGLSNMIFLIAIISVSVNVLLIYRSRIAQRINSTKIENEKILRESENKYKTLIESLIEGIGIVDENENFTFANKAGNEIFGCSNSELVGKNLKEFTSSDTFNYVLDKTSVRKQGNTDIYELKITGCDGIKRTILVKSSPIVDEAGNYKGAFGLFTDITEHKILEAKREMVIRDLETKVTNGNNVAGGFLPICASCHSIRDKDNNWHSAVDYLSAKTNIKFSHTICPVCKDELYGNKK